MVSKLQTLTSFWQEFNLTLVQSGLDDAATEITCRQDDSDVSKKALIDQMRQFKKDQDEAVRVAVAPLIKSFQNEVDMLTKRSKSAEKAFFEAYKRFTDISDPVPVLEHALEAQKGLGRVADMEIEIKQLRETIDDYNKEIQEYKVKEKRMHELQAKVEAYDKNIDRTLNDKIKDVTERMLEEYNEKLSVVNDEKSAIQKKSAEQESKLRSTQKQLKEVQDQLFEAQNGSDEKKAAKSEEVEILVDDLEKSNARAAAAEKEAEMLRERLATVREDVLAERERDAAAEREESVVPALNRELAAKEREVEHLLTDLQKLKSEKEREREASAAEVSELRRERDESERVIGGLEARLQAQSDYESIKKDLAVMRSVEFPGEAAAEDGSGRPLEVMILERSKALQTENTTLRVERDKVVGDLAQARKDLQEKGSEVEKQTALISELEEHVERLQELSNRGEAEGRSSADILVDALDTQKSSILDPLLSPSPLDSSSSAEESSSKALLPIVQAQRERFKQRNEELEEEQSRHLQQISIMQSEVNDLRNDNVKLYEKIRFLQGFQGRGGGQASSSGGDSVIPVESRYKSHYEQKMDPFSSFSHQERQKRYGQLNVFEKIILSFVQFMMSNKLARLFVFAYSVLLHLLVFLVLMRFAYLDSYRRDLASEWHDRYVQHMEDAHGAEEGADHLAGVG